MSRQVVSWFLLALGLSLSGWFEQFSPFAIFSIGGIASERRLRGLIQPGSPVTRFHPRPGPEKRLTYGQTLRFFGVLAFFKAWARSSPVFAIPTG